MARAVSRVALVDHPAPRADRDRRGPPPAPRPRARRWASAGRPSRRAGRRRRSARRRPPDRGAPRPPRGRRAPRGSDRSTPPGSTGRATARRRRAIAVQDAGRRRARSTPSNRIAFTWSTACRCTQYSWKCRSSGSPAGVDHVDPRGHGVVGHRAAAAAVTPNRVAHSSAVASRERAPVVRGAACGTRCVARSRSPRPNQASLRPERPQLLRRAERLVGAGPSRARGPSRPPASS